MKRLVFLLVTVAASVLFAAAPAAAQGVNDFIINDFTADYTLSNQDNQGLLEVREQITVTFSGNNHGLLRAIPSVYKDQDLHLQVDSVTYGNGAAIPYTTYKENDNTVLKIGNPDRTVTGQQQYDISYHVENVIGFYDNHDEFYWDINGDEWLQVFERVSVRLNLGEGLRIQQAPACYTGSFGSEEQYCTVSQEDGVIAVETTGALSPRQTLTIVAGFDKGYFAPLTDQERFMALLPHLLGFVLPPLLIGGYGVRHWRRHGRDPKGRGTIVPQYDPPFDLRPAEVGALADFRVDQKDITAVIIDLAVRRYIRIIEEKKVKRLRKDTLEYSLELTNADMTDLRSYEQKIIEGIFGEKFKLGKTVKLKDLKNKFYITSQEAAKQVTALLVSRKYFAGNPVTAGGRLWVLLVVCLAGAALAGALQGVGGAVGFGLAAIIVLVCALAMSARTKRGVEAKEHAEGLKLYMETAEADRIKMMQSPDAPYNFSAEPERTVELFEKLLPYAVVFSIEKQWAAEFKDIYTQPPDWYTGNNINAFSAGYITGALTGSMNTAMSTAFSSPGSSSSSGFSSGGGFSGGGGGGGGGGGW